MSLEVIPVWKETTPEIEAELVELWLGHKALADAQQAAARAKWAVCLARSEQGAIVGVSTAHPRVVPRLRQPMYHYRNFIAAEFRGEQLAASFLIKSKDALQAFNLALPEPRCVGIIMALDGQSPTARHGEAQWKEGPTFIGYSPKGLQLRAWYFDAVSLFAPMPLKFARSSAR